MLLSKSGVVCKKIVDKNVTIIINKNIS